MHKNGVATSKSTACVLLVRNVLLRENVVNDSVSVILIVSFCLFSSLSSKLGNQAEFSTIAFNMRVEKPI